MDSEKQVADIAQPRRLVRRTAKQWRELLEQWVVSGETVVEFCRREVASTCQFYAWRRRLEIGLVRPQRPSVAPEGDRSGFVEALVVQDRAGLFSASDRATLAAVTDGPLEVVLARSRRRVRVTGDFDEHLLRKLVRILESI